MVLCDTCARGIPQLCAFMREPDPETGLEAMGASARRKETTSGVLYFVEGCPAYRRGPIPGLKEAAELGHSGIT
ncbi:MAG: hypothetical protein K6T66_13130 [Peptococcaceae bacterium]|nr:hypothetical protein [Peptococcaceae bacterium]